MHRYTNRSIKERALTLSDDCYDFMRVNADALKQIRGRAKRIVDTVEVA